MFVILFMFVGFILMFDLVARFCGPLHGGLFCGRARGGQEE